MFFLDLWVTNGVTVCTMRDGLMTNSSGGLAVGAIGFAPVHQAQAIGAAGYKLVTVALKDSIALAIKFRSAMQSAHPDGLAVLCKTGAEAAPIAVELNKLARHHPSWGHGSGRAGGQNGAERQRCEVRNLHEWCSGYATAVGGQAVKLGMNTGECYAST